MLDSTTMADQLYGASAPPSPPPPPPLPSSDAPLADRLYPSSNPTPPNKVLLRNTQAEVKPTQDNKPKAEDYFDREQRLSEGLYGKEEDESSNTEPTATEAQGIDESIQSSVPASVNEIRNSEDRANLENDFSIEIPDEEYEKVFEDPLVGKAIAQEIRAIANDLALTYSDLDTIGDAIGRIQETPWTDESRMQSRERAVQLLNEEFGYGAAQAYRDAVKLANRDPRVLRMLEESGAGDDAGVVLALARAAKTQKNRTNYQRSRR